MESVLSQSRASRSDVYHGAEFLLITTILMWIRCRYMWSNFLQFVQTQKKIPCLSWLVVPDRALQKVISTLYPALRKVHQKRTLVFLDQRGTGKSEPLDCELPEDDGVEIPVEALQTCVSELPRSASWYQTEYLATDTNWVRQVLGYPSINLYGVSYGTRLGFNDHAAVSNGCAFSGIGWCGSLSKVDRW